MEGQDSPVDHIFRIWGFGVFGNLDGDLVSPYPRFVKMIVLGETPGVAVSDLIRLPYFRIGKKAEK